MCVVHVRDHLQQLMGRDLAFEVMWRPHLPEQRAKLLDERRLDVCVVGLGAQRWQLKVSEAVESATSEAASSGTRGGGCPAAPPSPWECRATQSPQARPEAQQQQEPRSGTTKALGSYRGTKAGATFDHAVGHALHEVAVLEGAHLRRRAARLRRLRPRRLRGRRRRLCGCGGGGLGRATEEAAWRREKSGEVGNLK